MIDAEYKKNLELFDQNIIKPDFFPDAVWVYSLDGELSWNTDSDLDDLENGSGNTHSMDYIIDDTSLNGYTLFTGNDSFGDTHQIIFRDINRHG